MPDFLDGAPYKLLLGDCLRALRLLETGSVDVVVTDPTYPDYHTGLYRQTPIDFFGRTGLSSTCVLVSKG